MIITILSFSILNHSLACNISITNVFVQVYNTLVIDRLIFLFILRLLACEEDIAKK